MRVKAALSYMYPPPPRLLAPHLDSVVAFDVAWWGHVTPLVALVLDVRNVVRLVGWLVGRWCGDSCQSDFGSMSCGGGGGCCSVLRFSAAHLGYCVGRVCGTSELCGHFTASEWYSFFVW